MLSILFTTFIAAVLSVSVADQVSSFLPPLCSTKQRQRKGATAQEKSTWASRTAADWVGEALLEYKKALDVLNSLQSNQPLQNAVLLLGQERMQSFSESGQNPLQEIMYALGLVRESTRVLTNEWKLKAPQKYAQMLPHLGMTLFYLIMATNATEYAPSNTRMLAAELLQSMKDDRAEDAARKAVEVADSMLAGMSKRSG